MMKRGLLLCTLLLFIGQVVAAGDSVLQIVNATLEKKVGERVILPCFVEMNITHQRVEWFKGEKSGHNDQPIHKCIWRPNATHERSDEFKNLTSLFEDQLSSGNFSLSLKLNASHNGSYYCYVGGRLYCIVTIKVLSEGEDDSSQMNPEVTVSPVNPNNGTDGLIIGGAVSGVLAVVALIIIIIIVIAVVFWYHKRREPNNPPINQEVPLEDQQPPENEENEPEDQNPNEEQSQMLENEDQDNPADDN